MIDLHSHTDQSDGSSTPSQLIEEACALRLEALAITDHDTLAGYDLAEPLARAAGLELICGIELSTRMHPKPAPRPDGRRQPSVHLLGYFVNTPPTAAFRDWLWNWQESRRKRNVALVARLNSLGVDIRLEEAQELGSNLTGRPHFAQVLLRKGYVSTIQEAFDRYLADHAQAAVERDEPTLQEGIRYVRDAGGIPVIAHPIRLLQGREPDALRTLLVEMMAEGLGGLEVYYSDHTPADVALYSELAGELGLAMTGGSDYHGVNKPAIHLGTGKANNLALPYSVLEQLRRHQISRAAAAD